LNIGILIDGQTGRPAATTGPREAKTHYERHAVVSGHPRQVDAKQTGGDAIKEVYQF
jgi:hypothetical protein